MSKFEEFLERSKSAKDFNKNMVELKKPAKVREWESSKSAMQVTCAAFFMPALIVAVIFFVWGKYDIALRSIAVFVAFYALSYWIGKKIDKAIKNYKSEDNP